MVAPLVLPLRYSRSLLAVLILAHLVPLAASCGSGVSLVFRCIVIFVVSISMFFQYRRVKNLVNYALELDVEGNVFVIQPNERKQVTLHTGYADLGWWIVLYWHDETNCREEHVIVLAHDALGGMRWRALKVWLYWHSVALDSDKNKF